MLKLLRRLFCRHPRRDAVVLGVEWDGAVRCRCTRCDKVFEVPL